MQVTFQRVVPVLRASMTLQHRVSSFLAPWRRDGGKERHGRRLAARRLRLWPLPDIHLAINTSGGPPHHISVICRASRLSRCLESSQIVC